MDRRLAGPEPFWKLQRKRKHLPALGIEPRLFGVQPVASCYIVSAGFIWCEHGHSSSIAMKDRISVDDMNRLLASQDGLCPTELRTSRVASLVSAPRPSHLDRAKWDARWRLSGAKPKSGLDNVWFQVSVGETRGYEDYITYPPLYRNKTGNVCVT